MYINTSWRATQMTREELLNKYANGERDFAGANLAYANLAGAYLAGANLTGAYLARADLTGANLTHADIARADLAYANLTHAYLTGANLTGADLNHAELAGANLTGAYLARANLTGANLTHPDLANQWIIQGAVRSDGYAFLLQKLKNDAEPMVKAGCRYYTLVQARDHWMRTRKDTPLGDETFAILDNLEALARARGYLS
jgi:hypothetical protein